MGRTKKSVTKCTTGNQFIATSRKQGAHIVEGGRHTKIYSDRGMVVVSNSSRDTPRGTQRSIVKTLLALGFVILAIAGPAYLLVF